MLSLPVKIGLFPITYMKKITLSLVMVLCLSSIGCTSTNSTSPSEVKADPQVFFTELQTTVDEIVKKVAINDYVGAKAVLASQKASLQTKCRIVKSTGGSYPQQLTIKKVAARATLQDAMARSGSPIDLENAESSKVNDQRELMKEFDEICSL
jgi:hypothetical protein